MTAAILPPVLPPLSLIRPVDEHELAAGLEESLNAILTAVHDWDTGGAA